MQHTSHNRLSCHVITCHDMSHIAQQIVMSCHVMLCYVMACHVMSLPCTTDFHVIPRLLPMCAPWVLCARCAAGVLSHVSLHTHRKWSMAKERWRQAKQGRVQQVGCRRRRKHSRYSTPALVPCTPALVPYPQTSTCALPTDQHLCPIAQYCLAHQHSCLARSTRALFAGTRVPCTSTSTCRLQSSTTIASFRCGHWCAPAIILGSIVCVRGIPIAAYQWRTLLMAFWMVLGSERAMAARTEGTHW